MYMPQRGEEGKKTSWWSFLQRPCNIVKKLSPSDGAKIDFAFLVPPGTSASSLSSSVGKESLDSSFNGSKKFRLAPSYSIAQEDLQFYMESGKRGEFNIGIERGTRRRTKVTGFSHNYMQPRHNVVSRASDGS
jgi:hypothetical protein